MSTDDPVDPNAILDALGIRSPSSVEPVLGGADTQIWRVEHGGATYALRVFRPEQAGVDDDEARTMEVARGAGLPVPRVEGHIVWRDRPALLLSWCPGRPTIEIVLGDPTTIPELGMELGRMQARMHAVRVPADIRGSPHTWIRRAGKNEHELRDALLALDLEADALLHLDYHPLNIMANGSTVTCILDWANADAGDPRADVARTHTILLLSPVPPGADADVTPQLRRALVDAWWQGYTEVSGTPRDMPLFYAWAGKYMALDLGAKIGRPDMWIQDHHLDPIRRYTEEWRQRAGLHA